MHDERFRAAPALAPLKAFQRRTVDYVFDRLYGPQDPTRQFLVADEVGLGKTMVARGVIARTIEHLWDRTDRIDILYICSNQAIAAQNIRKLNVLDRKELSLPTRMTLIPLQLRGQAGLEANRVNFISLTPRTTFDLRSSTGVAQERAFLRHLLCNVVSRPRGLHNMLQCTSGADGWNQEVDRLDLAGVEGRIVERFREAVRADSELFQELECVCEMFPRRRESYPSEMTQPRNALVGRLRARLSHACIEALQPDLIILDEFQRFRELLHGTSDAAKLARELFEYTDGGDCAARALLLSATPYRMLTLAGDDPEEGDHQQDFIETVKFLYGRQRGATIAVRLEHEMRAFRGLLQRLPASHSHAVEARRAVEQRLRAVMARTERVGSTANRDSMVTEPPVAVELAPEDLVQVAIFSSVAKALDAPEIVEYWKSAPYLLNFMRHYLLKRLLEEKSGSAELRKAMQDARPAMLDRDKLHAYAPLEPANGRMRAVMEDVFGAGLARHLWIPPSMPYYGRPRSDPPPTKALVFSSWSMVPDAIAALFSYEAERQMGVGASGQGYFDKQRPRPLQFGQTDGRLAGLRALLLIYPSPTLAEVGDPLAIYAEEGCLLSEGKMRAAVAERLRPGLDALSESASGDHAIADWASPAIMDVLLGSSVLPWLSQAGGLASLAEEEGFHEHVAALAEAASQTEFGSPPDGLLDLLVDVALGSPAVCALRALHRIAPELDMDDPRLMQSAAGVAWGFRTLFNQHDVIALLRQGGDDSYWHHVLTHCATHNLQSVLDEYAHYLLDSEGLGAHSPEERACGVGRAMAAALSIRPSQIEVDDPQVSSSGVTLPTFRMRGRFAMRLADYRDEEGTVSRLGGVRDAFNSPFRPFVLATTSVGQEGLDFHPYCYRVYHWNLPGNPVDLEQREGRVHRFKGHAIRLNLAERQAAALRGRVHVPEDPWAFMFARARSESDIDSELVPYWIYEGAVRVERRVPMLPFSREITRLEWLKRSLTVYRLAFGQPRQDDLLEYLERLVASGLSSDDLSDLQISLQPVASKISPIPKALTLGSGQVDPSD